MRVPEWKRRPRVRRCGHQDWQKWHRDQAGPVGAGEGCPSKPWGQPTPRGSSQRKPGSTQTISHPLRAPASHWLRPVGAFPGEQGKERVRQEGGRWTQVWTWAAGGHPMGASSSAAQTLPCCHRDLAKDKHIQETAKGTLSVADPGRSVRSPLSATPTGLGCSSVSEMPDTWPPSPGCRGDQCRSRCRTASQRRRSGCVFPGL